MQLNAATAALAAEPTSEEAATVEEAVLMATVRVGRRLRQRLPGEEIEFSSIALLKALAHRGPMRLSTLAHRLDLDASTVSRHVRSLEDRGLLERATDPEDGRASVVALTAEGRARLERGGARRRALVAEVLAPWSEQERETLRRLLNRLAHDVAEHPGPSRPAAPTAQAQAAPAHAAADQAVPTDQDPR